MLIDSKELDSDQLREKSRISGVSDSLLLEYFGEIGLSDTDAQKKLFIIRSVMYGSLQTSGDSAVDAIATIKEFLEKEFNIKF